MWNLSMKKGFNTRVYYLMSIIEVITFKLY